MRSLFTDLMLKNLTSDGADRLEVWDRRIPGFGVRVSKAGTKTFILVYRHRARTRRLTLGRYPFLSLADARDKAAAALGNVANAQDPALAREVEDDPAYQFETVLKRFIATHCRVHNKASTAREHERLLRKHFEKAWGKRDIRDIAPAQINAILDALIAADTPSEANHALGVIKTLFAWCVERDLLDVSPCMKVKKPAKHGSRSRTLTDKELAAVWRAAQNDDYPFGQMTQLLILTGQRRGEVTNMHWPQIDWQLKTWTIPPELAKNEREHVLPLSDTAVAILKQLPHHHKQLVFPARGGDGSVISGFTRAKTRLDKTSGVSDWTLHDLRRTVATGMAKLGIAPHVIERILNHISGTFAGVAGVYNRFQYLDEMRDALVRWEAHVIKIVRDAELQTADGKPTESHPTMAAI